MQQVSLDDAKKHLGDLIEAAVKGDEVIITREDRPVVKLVPVRAGKTKAMFGSAKGLIKISDDFDESQPIVTSLQTKKPRFRQVLDDFYYSLGRNRYFGGD